MSKYLQLAGLLLLLLMVSCTGNTVVKEDSVQPVGVAQKEQVQDPYLFILGPRDEITINVWRNDDLKRTVQIDPSGNIQFPLVGEMKASGLTVVQLREKLTQHLSRYLVNPYVDVSVSNLRNLKVHVLGEVKSPGTFEWRSGMMAWEGITQAGGFTTDADETNLLLVRNENGKVAIKALNLRQMLRGENLTQDVYLRNGDVVYVLPTFIANVQRFMTRLNAILAPITNLESGIILYPQARDVLQGKEGKSTTIVPTN